MRRLIIIGALLLPSAVHAQQPQQQRQDPALAAVMAGAQDLTKAWLITSAELGVCLARLEKTTPPGGVPPQTRGPLDAPPPAPRGAE